VCKIVVLVGVRIVSKERGRNRFTNFGLACLSAEAGIFDANKAKTQVPVRVEIVFNEVSDKKDKPKM